MSSVCPMRPNPVTSVPAFISDRRRGSSLTGMSLRVIIERIASFVCSASSVISALIAVAMTPVPSGFVRIITSPGRAPETFQIRRAGTSPKTTSPNFGSSSSTLCPPARKAPDSVTFSMPPASTDWRMERSSFFDGKPTTLRATSGRPPIA